jgi:hypothetical protein
LFNEVLTAVDRLKGDDQEGRALALAALTPRFAILGYDQQVKEALAEVPEVDDGSTRTRALAMMTPYFASLPRDTLHSTWCKMLPVLACDTRSFLVQDVGALAPVIDAMGGEEAVAEALRAIQDIGRWWPWD